jgi:hypothetical protein
MKNIRFIVQCIPARADFVTYLTKHIQPHVRLETVCDEEGKGARATWGRLITSIGNDAAVTLEDDCILTTDFVNKVHASIKDRRHSVIQMFSRMRDDITKGARWRKGHTFLGTVCVYYPAFFCSGLLEFARQWDGWLEHPNGYDLCIRAYLKVRKLDYWQQVPSLVEHAAVTSAIDSRRSTHRQSTTFVDPEMAGLHVPVPPIVIRKQRGTQ